MSAVGSLKMESNKTTQFSAKVDEELQLLKEWLSKQRHLPEIEDEQWLTTFLYNNKLDVEKTKFKLENYFSLRNKYPDILKGRDPTTEELQRTRKTCNLSISPRSQRDGARIFSFKTGDLSNFEPSLFAKRYFMILDTLLLEQDRTNSPIVILDCRTLSYRHIFTLTSGAGTLLKIFQSAYMGRSQAVHILIGGQYFVDKIVWILLKYLPKKYVARVFVHSATSDSLMENVDEDLLCSDYGGKGFSLAQMDEYTQQLLEKYKPWFERQDTVCSNESMRQENKDHKGKFLYYFRKRDIPKPVLE